jgi:hypothetical protein
VKRYALLLPLVLLFAGCAGPAPSIRRTGTMPAGGTIVVRNERGDINAYAPERGQPADMYTIEAYAPGNDGNAAVIQKSGLLVTAQSKMPGVRYLVRGPKGGAMDLSTQSGSIMVADFEGVVNARNDRGDVKMLIPEYGNVSVGTGNVSVIFASTDWPGTLHFTTDRGNIELYVNENAKAHVRLHTDNGNVFSDFPSLAKGTSQGESETIDSVINGGGPRSIDVEVKTGSIRVMQLKPQV